MYDEFDDDEFDDDIVQLYLVPTYFTYGLPTAYLTAPELTVPYQVPSKHSRPQHVECAPTAARFLCYKESA